MVEGMNEGEREGEKDMMQKLGGNYFPVLSQVRIIK